MRCQNCRDAIASARYVYGLGDLRRLTVLCAECAGKLVAIGMDLRRERTADLRPEEAQDTRPVWLRRGNAKVLDHGGSVA